MVPKIAVLGTMRSPIWSVLLGTDGEIYVSISIGEYIITFTCFLHCAKKGRVVENIESEVAT